MTETSAPSAIEGTTVGLYVTTEIPSSDHCDVGVIIEGVVALSDLENVAPVSAMLFGLFYALNMRYPSKLLKSFKR